MSRLSAKGSSFESRVAALFDLLGARVERAVEICGKKVDLFVTLPLPGMTGGHRLLVECKAERKNRAQNQRVMEFKGLLETARSAGLADGAEIITMARWSEQAKGFALKAGISVLTLEEKIRGLIDFGPYLRSLIDSVRSKDADNPTTPPLSSYYVTAGGRWHSTENFLIEEKVEDLVSDLLKRALSPESSFRVAVLGDYGVGKTSLCRMLAAQLAEAYLKDPSKARIPILLRLHDFTHTFRHKSVITNFLDEQCSVANPRYGLFREMRDAGLFIFLLDGFDEMAEKADAETIALNAHELDILIGGDGRALLTSRPEFFLSDLELRATLAPADSPIPMGAYTLLSMEPWTEDKVALFFRKRVSAAGGSSKEWNEVWRRIESVGLSDLAYRPVMADMIVRTLPTLLASAEPLDRSQLYELYLHGELKRQRFARGRGLLLTDEQRLNILQRVAAEMHIETGFILDLESARLRLTAALELPRDELNAYAREFLTCSFLRRTGSRYYFSHRSIQEYLVAREYARNIREADLSALGRKPLDVGVGSFLIELLRRQKIDDGQLRRWLTQTSRIAVQRFQFIGGVAATILVLMDKASLSKADLTRASLLQADLRFADLRGAILKESFVDDVDVRAARFSWESLSQANRFSGRFLCIAIGKEGTSATDVEKGLDAVSKGTEDIRYVGMATATHGDVDITVANMLLSRSGGGAWPLKDDLLQMRQFSDAARKLECLKEAWVFEEERIDAIQRGLISESGLEEILKRLTEEVTVVTPSSASLGRERSFLSPSGDARDDIDLDDD